MYQLILSDAFCVFQFLGNTLKSEHLHPFGRIIIATFLVLTKVLTFFKNATELRCIKKAET